MIQLDITPNEKVSSYGRKITPNKTLNAYYSAAQAKTTPSKAAKSIKSNESNDSDTSFEQDDLIGKDCTMASKDFLNSDVAGSEIFQFSTPKKSDGMKRKAENTPKSPATALSRLSLNSPKTPRMMPTTAAATLRTQNFATPTETRTRNKKALAQQLRKESESESSADEHSEYEAEGSSDSTSDDENENANTETTTSDDEDDLEEPKQLRNKRNAMTKQKTVELPTRTRGRPKKKPNEDDFIPDSDNYFLTAANKKVSPNFVNFFVHSENSWIFILADRFYTE